MSQQSYRLHALLARAAAVVLSMLSLAGGAFADDDPPGRVGRLAEVDGTVWIYSPDGNEWVAAARNRPITSGDRVATDDGARAELSVGSTTVRLDGNTELEAVRLDDDRMHWQLHSGSAAVRLHSRANAREFEMLTRDGRFLPQQAGHYRIDRNQDMSAVTAWSGSLRFEGERESLTVEQGQRAEIWSDGRTHYSLADSEPDAFSDWVAAREREEQRSVSSRYVSREMTGVEDLDRHGHWHEHTDYGALWVPRVVAPGWAPYRYGHWAFIRPWGWTWVDDAPWGFAPFHYGRWVHFRGAWGWAPGHYVARPVYAPALVAWIGGPRVSVSVRVGSSPQVGWFPLGPREVYVPGYRTSRRYVRNVNVTHVTNVTHITNVTNVTNVVNKPGKSTPGNGYVNRNVRGAVTIVPADVVTGRRPVAPVAAGPADDRAEREIARRPVTHAPPVAVPVVAAPATFVPRSPAHAGRAETTVRSRDTATRAPRERESDVGGADVRRRAGREPDSGADGRRDPVARGAGEPAGRDPAAGGAGVRERLRGDPLAAQPRPVPAPPERDDGPASRAASPAGRGDGVLRSDLQTAPRVVVPPRPAQQRAQTAPSVRPAGAGTAPSVRPDGAGAAPSVRPEGAGAPSVRPEGSVTQPVPRPLPGVRPMPDPSPRSPAMGTRPDGPTLPPPMVIVPARPMPPPASNNRSDHRMGPAERRAPSAAPRAAGAVEPRPGHSPAPRQAAPQQRGASPGARLPMGGAERIGQMQAPSTNERPKPFGSHVSRATAPTSMRSAPAAGAPRAARGHGMAPIERRAPR